MGIKSKLSLAIATTALGATLIGAGTFAIFTSTAANTGNSFTAGTLTISLDKADGVKYFNVGNIAPGDSGSTTVTVHNGGSLDLRYSLNDTPSGTFFEGATPATVTIKDASGNVVTPSATKSHTLASGAADDVYTVSWQLPLAANDDYQSAKGSLAINVNAEQTKNN